MAMQLVMLSGEPTNHRRKVDVLPSSQYWADGEGSWLDSEFLYRPIQPNGRLLHIDTINVVCSAYKKLSYRRGTARCVISVEILPRNSAETTCTSPEQIELMKLEGDNGPMCNKHVHSTMTRSSRFHRPIGVKNKPTTHRVVDITCVPTTLMWPNFPSPQCRNSSGDPDHAHLRNTHSSQD